MKNGVDEKTSIMGELSLPQHMLAEDLSVPMHPEPHPHHLLAQAVIVKEPQMQIHNKEIV